MKIVNVSKVVSSVLFLSFWYYNSLAQNDGSVKKSEEGQEQKTELGVVAGASLTGLHFKGGGPEEIVENDYDLSLNATVGFFCDVSLRSNKWSISNDLIYNSFNVNGEGDGGIKFNYHYRTASFSYHFIKTHHIMRMHLGKKQKFFVGAGLSTGLAFPQKSEIRIDYFTNLYDDYTIPVESRNFEFGIVGGFGLSFGKWRGEARYEYSTGILSYSADFAGLYYQDTVSNTSRMYLLAKYRLR